MDQPVVEGAPVEAAYANVRPEVDAAADAGDRLLGAVREPVAEVDAAGEGLDGEVDAADAAAELIAQSHVEIGHLTTRPPAEVELDAGPHAPVAHLGVVEVLGAQAELVQILLAQERRAEVVAVRQVFGLHLDGVAVREAELHACPAGEVDAAAGIDAFGVEPEDAGAGCEVGHHLLARHDRRTRQVELQLAAVALERHRAAAAVVEGVEDGIRQVRQVAEVGFDALAELVAAVQLHVLPEAEAHLPAVQPTAVEAAVRMPEHAFGTGREGIVQARHLRGGALGWPGDQHQQHRQDGGWGES